MVSDLDLEMSKYFMAELSKQFKGFDRKFLNFLDRK